MSCKHRNHYRAVKRVIYSVTFFLLLTSLISPVHTQTISDFTDTFGQDPNTSGKWSIHRRNNDPFNEASWSQSEGVWYLTRTVDGRAVAVFANYQLVLRKWTAQFDMKIGGGNNADGLAFMFYKDQSLYGRPDGGGSLGFTANNRSIPGYGIAFDTFRANQIALIQDRVTTVLTSTSSVVFRDNTFHTLEVSFDHGLVVVEFDGAQILRHMISNPVYTYSGVGFSAATGGSNDNHIIDNFSIFVGDVRVDQPNGGEFWAGGSSQQVKWTLGGPATQADNIVLFYSTDGGASFPNIIASSLSVADSQYDWNIPGINSGNTIVKVEAQDGGGSEVASDVSNAPFTIDSEPPSTFNLTLPQNGQWVDSTPTFQWTTATDNFGLSHYKLVIDSQVVVDSLFGRQYTLSGSEVLTAGFHVWNVIAVDRVGHERQSQETRSIRVDDDNPLGFNLMSPTNDSWTGSTTPEFEWQPSVDLTSDIKEYELFIDGNLVRTIPPSATKATPFTSLGFGEHDWYVVAIDSAANRTQSQETWKIKVDNVPPGGIGGLTGSYHTSPGTRGSPNFGRFAGQRVDPSINFDWGRSSPGFGIDSDDFQIRWTGFLHTSEGGQYVFKTHSDDGARLWIDNDLIIDAWREGAGDVFSPPKTLQPDSLYTIKMEYYENETFARARLFWRPPGQGEQIIPSEKLRVHPVRAFVPISPPNNNWLGDPTPRFTWQKPDDVGIGTQAQSLWINSAKVIANISPDSSGMNLPEENKLAGSAHSWFVEAVDSLGNLARTPTWTIRLDLQPPNPFSLNSPSDSSAVKIPTPTFSWNSSFDNQSGLSHYQIWVNGELNTDQVTKTSSAPTIPVTIGTHNWLVKAIDRVGNTQSSSETWTFFLDPDKPNIFDLVSPSDGDTVITSLPTLVWRASRDAETGLGMYQLFINGALNRSNIAPTDTISVPESPLANGTYAWFIKAFDLAGNSISSVSQRSFVLIRDIAPPASSITEPSDGITIGGDSLVVQGTATDGAGAGVQLVEVSIDGGNWQPANNTGVNFGTWDYVWSGFSEGIHTIQTRASDKEGNTESPGPGVTVTVDRSTPSLSSISISPNLAIAGQISVTINFAPGAGSIDNLVSPTVTFIPANDTTRFDIQQSSFQGSTWVGTATITENMNNGTAAVQVEGVQNSLGNVIPPLSNAGSFVIDTVAPVVSEVIVTPNPAKVGNINVSVSFTEETTGLNSNVQPIATLSFSPNDESPIPITLTGYVAATQTVQGVASITSSLNDGPAIIQVKDARDLAGNVMADNDNAGKFTIDVTGPTPFNLLSPPDSMWIDVALPAFSWAPSTDATTGLANYQLFVDSKLNLANIPTHITTVEPHSDLKDGEYLWHIMAVDSIGNKTRSNSIWLVRVDTTPPQSEISNLTSGQEVAGVTVIEGTANDGLGASAGIGVAKVEVSTDSGATWEEATNTGTDFNTWRYEWTVPRSENFTVESRAVDKLGNEEIPSEGIVVTDIERSAQIPTKFALAQNYPNPFNPETTIEYNVSKKAQITIKIYNLMGQEIVTLVNEDKAAGYFRVNWTGKDSFGNQVASGIYVYRMRAGDFVASRKLILIR